MTLQQLSDAWNALRNAALGRTAQAAVPAQLAEQVGRAWEAFSAWLADQGPFSEVLGRLVGDSDAAQWVELYNELRVQVAAQGRAVPRALHVPSSLAGELGDTARTALFLAAAGAGFAFLLLRGRRRG